MLTRAKVIPGDRLADAESVRPAIDEATSALMASLRGWSALVVVLAHAFQVFVLPYLGLWGWPHLLTSWLACYAVLTFFVVSGFMIAVSVHRHRTPNGFAQWAFLRSRVLRIHPPLLASVLLCVLILAAFRGFGIHGSESFRLGGEQFLSRERVEMGLPETASTLLLTYTVVPHAPGPVQMNGPLWTLTYEWWFYLLAMFASTAVIGRRVLMGVVPTACVLLLFAKSPAGMLLWAFLAVWGAGFALACAYLAGLLQRPRAPLVLCLIALSALAGVVAIGRGDTLRILAEPLQRLGNRAHWSMCLVSIAGACLLGMAIRLHIRGIRCGRLADFSYTLYLVHYPLLLLGFGLLHPSLHAYGVLPSAVCALLLSLLILPLARSIAFVVEDRERFGRMLTAATAILRVR